MSASSPMRTCRRRPVDLLTAITVRVPATSANLGAGFDCLGLALDMFASITVTFGDGEQPPTEDVGEKMVLTADPPDLPADRQASAGRDPGALQRLHPARPGPGRQRRRARRPGSSPPTRCGGHPLDEGVCLDHRQRTRRPWRQRLPGAVRRDAGMRAAEAGTTFVRPAATRRTPPWRSSSPTTRWRPRRRARPCPRATARPTPCTTRAARRSSWRRWRAAAWTCSTRRPTTGSTSTSGRRSSRRCSKCSRRRRGPAPTRPG